jgi:uncharacterized protein YjbI with pentapeptide repeats
MWKRVALCALSLCVACSADDARHGSILHLQRFAKDSSLTAHSGDVVILDDLSGNPSETAIPFQLEQGNHRFCLEGRAAAFKDVSVEDSSGNVVFKIPNGRHCAIATLAQSGIYIVRIPASDQPPTELTDTARLEADLPGPRLFNSPNHPVGGYWAMQPDPALDSQNRQGRLHVQLPFRPMGNQPRSYDAAAPVIVDFSSPQMDKYSLFRLPGPLYPLVPEVALLAGVMDGHSYAWTPLFYTVASDFADSAVITQDASERNFEESVTFETKDLGDYNLEFSNSCIEGNSFSNQALFYWVLTNFQPCQGIRFHIAFRFFPDGSQAETPAEGEVTLFQQRGYQGKAAVFPYGTQDLTTLDSSDITIGNTAQSVRLGNNTALLWQTASSGTVVIPSDTPDLSALSIPGPRGHNVQVLPLDVLLASSSVSFLNHKCVNCKLQNTSLAGINFEGWDLSGADLSGASVDNVNLNGATLTGARFTGARLTCVDLSGIDSQHLRDLTQTSLANVQWLPSTSCRNNLSYTKISTTSLPPATWKNLNLTGAVFVDLKPGTQLSSQKNPLDLTGVMLGGVSLEQINLDYAILSGADLTRTLLSNSSLQHVNLSGAKLYGAQLSSVNLDGANLSGATLIKPPSGSGSAANVSGAFLRNVNLSKAQISGANFTDATFYGTTPAGTGTCTPDPNTGFTNGCATAAGATMNSTQFSGAYLAGVDFSSAVAQGVQFGNSILTGANFANAAISADASGANTGFSGAFLQGANLAGITLQNGLSLASAFLDFSSEGNVTYLLLSGQHTTFAGYWNTPGQPVCAEMSYTNGTTVPATDSTVSCPDGNNYPAGCGEPFQSDGATPNTHWKSPVDITQEASYQFDSTFTNAPASGNSICAADPSWAGLNTARLGSPRPRERKPPKSRRPKPGHR